MPANVELRDFLQSRRARLVPPESADTPRESRRRVPGLRREEVARMAGVSVDYYTRLEQGRRMNVSSEVLGAVADALDLPADERLYLFQVAEMSRTSPRISSLPRQEVRPGILRVVQTLITPAFVLGRGLDVLATNAAARELICDFDALPPGKRNHARWVFLDPAARTRYCDWSVVARDNVASLRMQAVKYPDDEALAGLIAELAGESHEFASWWSDHEVVSRSHGIKRYDHPSYGEITIAYESLPVPEAPDQLVYIYSAEPGTESERALQAIAEHVRGPVAAAINGGDR